MTFLITLNVAFAAGDLCQNIKDDIEMVGNQIENFKINEEDLLGYKDVALAYDKALAEELLYRGLLDMVSKYQETSKLLSKPSVNYLENFTDVAKEGIDVRKRLLILNQLVDLNENIAPSLSQDEYFKQQLERCGKLQDSDENKRCRHNISEYRPMIDGYLAAMRAVAENKQQEVLTTFNAQLDNLSDRKIKKELVLLEETQAKILAAAKSCVVLKLADCKTVDEAIQLQQKQFQELQVNPLLYPELKSISEKHERLKNLHTQYKELDKNKTTMAQEFEDYKIKVAQVFCTPKGKESKNYNANDLLKDYCGLSFKLESLAGFQSCLTTVDINKLKEKAATAQKNKAIQIDKMNALLKNKKLDSLMELQQLLYARATSPNLNCSISSASTVSLVTCAPPDIDPIGKQLRFLIDNQYNIRLYMKAGREKYLIPDAVKMDKFCDAGTLTLKSCNKPTPEQIEKRQVQQEFHEKYYVEKDSRGRGRDRVVKRKSFSSMLAQSAITSLTAPDTMQFITNTMSFNSQLDASTQQAQWQKQYLYDQNKWSNAYFGNIYGGLNPIQTIFDPTLGHQNASNFGFSFI